MDKTIGTLREAITTAKANEKVIRTKLATVNAMKSTNELRENVQKLERERTGLAGRLGPLRKGDVKPVLPHEREMVDKRWKMWKEKARMRKKFALELWQICTEEVPEGKTKAEVWVRRSVRKGIICTDNSSVGGNRPRR